MSDVLTIRERRHTLHFLGRIRAFSPVFLDTEVDMTRIQAHRAAATADGRHYSLVTYVLHSAGRVLVNHPEANAAIQGRLRPRVARYPWVHGKLALDKTINGQRVVLSGLVPSVHEAGLDDIQAMVNLYRDGDPATMPQFAGARLMHRLPVPVGAAMFARFMRSLRRRPVVMGTVAVTSLAHRPVDGFHSVGGTTLTLGLGRVTDRPVVQGGRVAIGPRMRLNLTFDHRVIDGAEAADVLADLKAALEGFPAGTTPAERDAAIVPAD